MHERDPHDGSAPIESLIPHRPPMLLVERVVELLDQGIVCQGRIPRSGIFASRDTAPPILGVEMAAQSAAVLEALRRAAELPARSGDEGPRIGYLASIRDARFAVPALPTGTAILAAVRRTGGAGSLAMYDASLARSDDQVVLLTATLTTYLAE